MYSLKQLKKKLIKYKKGANDQEGNEEQENLSIFQRLKKKIKGEKPFQPRYIPVNGSDAPPPTNYIFPQNVIRNQKYSLISFFPVTLYEQFKSFINLVNYKLFIAIQLNHKTPTNSILKKISVLFNINIESIYPRPESR